VNHDHGRVVLATRKLWVHRFVNEGFLVAYLAINHSDKTTRLLWGLETPELLIKEQTVSPMQQWLLNLSILLQLCGWGRETCSTAARFGILCCHFLRYPHKNGCDWDFWTCTNAAIWTV
jgi:hypothetical protein